MANIKYISKNTGRTIDTMVLHTAVNVHSEALDPDSAKKTPINTFYIAEREYVEGSIHMDALYHVKGGKWAGVGRNQYATNCSVVKIVTSGKIDSAPYATNIKQTFMTPSISGEVPVPKTYKILDVDIELQANDESHAHVQLNFK